MNTSAAVTEAVEKGAAAAIALSERIHANPELGFEEVQASRWIADSLAETGFEVQMGVADLPTAFVATIGDGPLVMGVCAEYDALPGIGHACGHNLIAGSAVLTAKALAPLVNDLGITVKVFGTPAEENGGGKVLMLDAGVFAGTHAAMMIHPGVTNESCANVLAISDTLVDFHGKNAHASAAPYEGRNAGDAAVVAQVALGLLRQQLPPGDQIHGIVTNGGEAPNVIPAEASLHYYMRSADRGSLAVLEERVRKCFDGAATATDCTLSRTATAPVYTEFRNDLTMAELFKQHTVARGRTFDESGVGLGSTDMGNVSREIPAIHPMLALDCGNAVNHQPEFAACCVGQSADLALVDGAAGMAQTIASIAADDALRAHYLTV